jgi:hypothetical protein
LKMIIKEEMPAPGRGNNKRRRNLIVNERFERCC